MGWALQRDHGQRMTETERLAELRKPPAANPPHLTKPTRCTVLKAFCVAGKRVELGQTVTLEFHVARDLAAIHKVEVLRD